ncbi:FkbM family methyltransferase [Haloactinospora alba]|uniref:FkbM family methyltransferase n=1 Tax=Haloactinospora alba TaxID=405555 RepID=A0A543NEX2_9ACTN|nr:FkbM family methyltransferase [Haloactinospora alba]
MTNLGPGTALLSRNKNDRFTTLPFGEGAQLVVNKRRSAKEELAFQKSAANYLGARHVAALLEHYGANCVLDVGANVGQYAKQLRRHGYTGRIVSFEPVPGIVEKLRRAAAKDPNWWVYPHALGSTETSTTMNVVSGSMSSLLGPSEFGNRRYKRFSKIESQEVSVRRLDNILDEVLDGIDEPRPYLKLDTQGYDLEAFAGAGERIREFVGMQSEVALMQIYEGMPRMNEAIAAYEGAGFEITGMFPVTREESTGRVLEFDCVLARADSLVTPPAAAPSAAFATQ